MKTDIELHYHPAPGHPFTDKYTVLPGRELEPGDVLEDGDVYASTSGYWEPCPCPGLTLGQGVAVKWVRPS